MAYLDDIIIFSTSKEEHKQHIHKIFDCLRQHNLKLSKCTFMQKETHYPGFIIGEDGIIVDPDMVKVMRQMLPSTCILEVRIFIGMCKYYRRFIPKLSAIVKLFIRLMKKFEKFEWSKECQTAFDFLKENLTTVLVLAYQPLTNQTFSIQILVIIALGHVYAKNRIYKERYNQMSEMQNLFTICHINIQLHRQTGLQLKKRILLSFMLYRN